MLERERETYLIGDERKSFIAESRRGREVVGDELMVVGGISKSNTASSSSFLVPSAKSWSYTAKSMDVLESLMF